ncbi:hypothetical protein RIR_jg33396.t1 [Rhizophagus irregularis DAOM 181602=DAOM 197198]|nr:hypothetical protein RIR_jg33396.t1 [Rhizophagus irregularis DAOM 181602=DAOM 197198]
MEKPSFVRPFGWASVFRKTEKFQRFDRVGFRRMENQETKIRKIRWASEEQKPKDSFVSFRGSGKGELRFGWLLKPRFVRPFGFRNINIFELKSTVSHFPDRIVSASLSRMIGSIIIIDANIHVLYI